MRQQCEHVREDGSRCRGTALPSSTFCFAHDPASAARRKEACSTGGKARSKPRATLPADTPDFAAATLADLALLLERMINLTAKGELDTKVANAVGYLASIQQRVLSESDIERRLAALEVGRGEDNGQ